MNGRALVIHKPVNKPPFNTTGGFIARFVVPLLGGGVAEVGAPLSRFDRDAMLEDPGPLVGSELLYLRHRAAQRLTADPALDQPDGDELSLWIALHDILSLDHPDRDRVWTRGTTWQKVEMEVAGLLAQAHPSGLREALARHLAVGALLELRREDHIVTTPEGEQRYLGQDPPRRGGLFGASITDVRKETVPWVDQPHRPPVDRLLGSAIWISPLTALLQPGRAPAGWNPLMSVDFVRDRAFARAVCHTWARERDWLLIGAVLTGSLLQVLELIVPVFGAEAELASSRARSRREREEGVRKTSGDVPKTSGAGGSEPGASARPDPKTPRETLALPAPAADHSPAAIGAVIGALIHLHVLKVLEFDARIGLGLGARDWAVQGFLALPLLLPRLEPVLGVPFVGAPDESFLRRWEEYCEHLGGLVSRTVVDNLLATIVRRVVESQPA